MNCNQWRDLASEHMEGTLPADLRTEADGHVLSCASCRTDLDFLRGIERTFAEVPQEDPPLFFSDNIRSRIDASRRAAAPVSLRDRLGRLGLATAFVGTAVAGMFWGAMFPSERRAVPAGMAPALPRGASGPSIGPTPRLSVGWNQRADASDPAVDFSVVLAGTERGAVRCSLPGDPNQYRFALSEGVAQTLRVPLTASRGDRTLAVGIQWSAAQVSGVRDIYLPLPSTDQAPATRQSFSLPEMPARDALREIARRYAVPVVADNISGDVLLSLRAVDEPIDAVVRNGVSRLGWQVISSPDGVRVVSSR